jgi:hypothetical protein
VCAFVCVRVWSSNPGHADAKLRPAM